MTAGQEKKITRNRGSDAPEHKTVFRRTIFTY